MPTFGVVEALDVVEHICPGIVARPTDFAGDALGFPGRAEALRGGIVPDIAFTAHAATDAVICHQTLERLARVLGASIRMIMQRRQSAIIDASVTRCAVIVDCIDHPPSSSIASLPHPCAKARVRLCRLRLRRPR